MDFRLSIDGDQWNKLATIKISCLKCGSLMDIGSRETMSNYEGKVTCSSCKTRHDLKLVDGKLLNLSLSTLTASELLAEATKSIKSTQLTFAQTHASTYEDSEYITPLGRDYDDSAHTTSSNDVSTFSVGAGIVAFFIDLIAFGISFSPLWEGFLLSLLFAFLIFMVTAVEADDRGFVYLILGTIILIVSAIIGYQLHLAAWIVVTIATGVVLAIALVGELIVFSEHSS